MIESVSAIGVGPFKHALTFPVSGLGLVLVRGDNRVSSAANDNGAGKTSLFSFGLSWGCYGETLAGEKGDEVLNRFSKGPGVVEVVGVDPITKQRWKVIRGRRPKRVEAWECIGGDPNQLGVPDVWRRILEEADDRDVNAWVEDRYLPWRVFRNAVVFDRDVRFTRAGQDEQMRMIDRIQGIDLRAAFDRAKVWKGNVAEALATARVTAVSDASLRDEAAGQVAEMEGLRDGFRAEVAWRISEARSALSAAEEEDHFASTGLRDAQNAAAVAGAARLAFGRVQALADERDRIAVALQSAERDVERAEDDLNGVTRKVADLVKSGRCAACRQPTKDAVKIGAGFADDVEAATKRRRDAAANVKRCLRAEAGAAEALDVALKGISLVTREREVRDLEAVGSGSAVRHAEEVAAAAARRLTSATEALERARSEKWAGAAALKAVAERVRDLTASSERAERDAEKHARWLRVAEYWVEAFGDRGVRSLLFDSVAGFLQERAAVHLEALAAGEATLSVSATAALKGGGTRERLSIVPEWAWGGLGQASESGGQDTRTDLATFWAIRDLAETRSARMISPSVLDEPEGLDARGQEMFGAWITAEARRIGSVFLMTHNPALAACVEADEEWRVILHGPGDATLEREK